MNRRGEDALLCVCMCACVYATDTTLGIVFCVPFSGTVRKLRQIKNNGICPLPIIFVHVYAARLCLHTCVLASTADETQILYALLSVLGRFSFYACCFCEFTWAPWTLRTNNCPCLDDCTSSEILYFFFSFYCSHMYARIWSTEEKTWFSECVLSRFVVQKLVEQWTGRIRKVIFRLNVLFSLPVVRESEIFIPLSAILLPTKVI